MTLSQNSWLFWAKTPDKFTTVLNDEGNSESWLSLCQHLRDTADVGALLVNEWMPHALRNRVIRLAGDADAATSLISWLAGTHDIGKAELHFAVRLTHHPEHSRLSSQVLSAHRMEKHFVDPLTRRPHSVYSDLIISNWLRQQFPEADPAAVASLSGIAGCHHGKPSGLTSKDRRYDSTLQEWLRTHSPSWQECWHELISDITRRTEAHDALERQLSRGGIPLSDQLLLSGLVTMADWIASNQELFALTSSGRHDTNASRARDSLQRLGMTRSWTPRNVGLPPARKRFSWPEPAQLRPVQQAAADTASRIVGPSLVIIEEEMGQGKTEAALLAAEIIAARTGAGGVAFGLPTMATTDAMFSRLERWARSLVDESDESHSIFLGHSRSRLNPEFSRLRRRTGSVEAERRGSAVIAHQWFTGKKGLLAEFAVTTVDQILMAALATRHVTLRHLGLSGKVVIIDEVHSYDVYTSSYLARALTWLAAQEVPVIMLSATLASGTRKTLLDAYRKGLGRHDLPQSSRPADRAELLAKIAARKAGNSTDRNESERVETVPYPRLTCADATGIRQIAIEQREGHRRIKISIGPEDVVDALEAAGYVDSEGGVVGVVCNTVRRAQQAFDLLAERLDPGEIELIHSQFTTADRAERELRLVEQLGPRAARGSGRPRRRIVVGTQILEQSLDIDFDLLISDFAPTDALMQRAGRLHRHARAPSDRPPALRAPLLYLRGLDTAGSVPEFDRGARAIYGERVLLASLAVLSPFLDKNLCLMHDLDPLVNATYAADLAVPPAWRDRYAASVKKERTAFDHARRKAEQFQLKAPAASYGHMNEALVAMLESDAALSDISASAHVRDIEPGLEVLLVWERNGYLSPLPWLMPSGHEVLLGESGVPPRDISEILAASLVRLPRWLVPPGPSIDRAIDHLEKTGIAAWQADYLLRGQLLLRLDSRFEGKLLGKRFSYDNEVGLRALSDTIPAEGLDEVPEIFDGDDFIDEDWEW